KIREAPARYPPLQVMSTSWVMIQRVGLRRCPIQSEGIVRRTIPGSRFELMRSRVTLPRLLRTPACWPNAPRELCPKAETVGAAAPALEIPLVDCGRSERCMMLAEEEGERVRPGHEQMGGALAAVMGTPGAQVRGHGVGQHGGVAAAFDAASGGTALGSHENELADLGHSWDELSDRAAIVMR